MNVCALNGQVSKQGIHRYWYLFTWVRKVKPLTACMITDRIYGLRKMKPDNGQLSYKRSIDPYNNHYIYTKPILFTH
jgi:hypothetical protein